MRITERNEKNRPSCFSSKYFPYDKWNCIISSFITQNAFLSFPFFNLTTHLIFLTGAILFGTILRDLSGLLGYNLFRETVCETSENRDLTNSL